jgi:hypothetical protein
VLIVEPGHLPSGQVPGRNRDFVLEFFVIILSFKIFIDKTVSQHLMGGWRAEHSFRDHDFGFLNPA